VFVVLSSWNYEPILAIIAASGVILTAGYILWAMQRVYLGAEYRGPHPEAITPINARETAVAAVLLGFAILLGVYPESMFGLMRESMQQLAGSMDTGYQAAVQAASTAQLGN
jgi:NADH-quinone oxidoreductase subunit M